MSNNGDDNVDFAHTNFLFNHVARTYNLELNFIYRRVEQGGLKLWQATLFVNGVATFTGMGQRKGHAKDHASRQYLEFEGHRMPDPF